MSSALNRSGEPSEEVEALGAKEENRPSLKKGQDKSNISMSFIRQILDNEDLQRTDSMNAMDSQRGVSFSGIDSGSVASSTADDDKDHDELVSKIQTLKLDLKQAKLDHSAEKTMNRKKDRNLVKLAKELNRRGDEIVENKKTIGELNASIATLEAKLAANQKELQERVSTNEKQTRDHNSKVVELQDENRNVWREHHQKIAEMQDQHIKASQEHVETTDRMRKEILATNRTVEALRAELAKAKDQETADNVVQRGMTAPLTLSDQPVVKFMLTKEVIVAALLVVVLVVGYQLDLLSMNSMCSPIRPGATLKADVQYEAPWWAPTAKDSAFALCGKRPRTSLSLTEGNRGKKTLSVMSLDDDVPILQEQALSAVVHSGHISVTDKKGVSTDIKSPWAL